MSRDSYYSAILRNTHGFRADRRGCTRLLAFDSGEELSDAGDEIDADLLGRLLGGDPLLCDLSSSSCSSSSS